MINKLLANKVEEIVRLSRRRFLTLTSASAAGVVIASPLKKLYARSSMSKSLFTKGFGELVSDPQGIFDLPPGFQYRVFSSTGDKMGDGQLVPKNHDGMAAFAGPHQTTILIRNHEISPRDSSGVVAPRTKKYDPVASGGTTTLIMDRDRNLLQDFVSLAGTSRNCAGGTTPWGSWISCEEDVSTPQTSSVIKKHGYNFEVSLLGSLTTPIPLKAMGRFNHEAIAVDPKTGIIYQTEDRNDSCLYRFIPNQKGKLAAGGVLEALAIKGMAKVDTSSKFPISQPLDVEWVTIENIDPEEDTLRYEAQAKGAAIFKRGEGICYGNGEIYWTCTSGGNLGKGQIFRYSPSQNTVELYLEAPGANVLEHPDNLIMAPFGDLILCEDGGGEQFLVGVNPQGKMYHLGRNALNTSELAGVCFAPDGRTLFVNIQRPGLTLAVWGEWE